MFGLGMTVPSVIGESASSRACRWDFAAAASFSTFAAEARSALRTSCAARVAGWTSRGSSLRLPIRRAAVTARRCASQRTTSSSYAVSPISSTSSTLLDR